MNVLAVDDEAKIREAVSEYLAHQGMTVLTAENGRQALELFGTGRVDIVILDLMLPDISGEEVCRKIRETSPVPIIMLTARTQEEDMLRALDLGTDDYIKKPFSLKELYARMRSVLRRSGRPGSPGSWPRSLRPSTTRRRPPGTSTISTGWVCMR